MDKSILSHGLASQFLAGLFTLKDCIDRCPEKEWHKRHNDYPFSQVVFHTLFDCDYFLSDTLEEFKSQSFHQSNREEFGDYEELDDLTPQIFNKREFIELYFDHCKIKILQVIESKRVDDLLVPNSDISKSMTKLERYINLIRHMQHHTAQLGLRLQFLTGKEMAWISRGYEA